ncbi:141_t:CDS:2, partial [Paraglomus brasilianum]
GSNYLMFQPPSKRVKSGEPKQQQTPETSGEISVNKDRDDYSDSESDTSTEFDNDDDPDYVYSSGSSSCEETKFTKSAHKLDSDKKFHQ